MNAGFLRREWGAVTFVLTVLIGLVIVPVALYFGNQSPGPAVAATTSSPSPAVSASPTAVATPGATAAPGAATPVASPSKSP